MPGDIDVEAAKSDKETSKWKPSPKPSHAKLSLPDMSLQKRPVLMRWLKLAAGLGAACILLALANRYQSAFSTTKALGPTWIPGQGVGSALPHVPPKSPSESRHKPTGKEEDGPADESSLNALEEFSNDALKSSSKETFKGLGEDTEDASQEDLPGDGSEDAGEEQPLQMHGGIPGPLSGQLPNEVVEGLPEAVSGMEDDLPEELLDGFSDASTEVKPEKQPKEKTKTKPKLPKLPKGKPNSLLDGAKLGSAEEMADLPGDWATELPEAFSEELPEELPEASTGRNAVKAPKASANGALEDYDSSFDAAEVNPSDPADGDDPEDQLKAFHNLPATGPSTAFKDSEGLTTTSDEVDDDEQPEDSDEPLIITNSAPEEDPYSLLAGAPSNPLAPSPLFGESFGSSQDSSNTANELDPLNPANAMSPFNPASPSYKPNEPGLSPLSNGLTSGIPGAAPMSDSQSPLDLMKEAWEKTGLPMDWEKFEQMSLRLSEEVSTGESAKQKFNATPFVTSILDYQSEVENIDRMVCDEINHKRYAYLKVRPHENEEHKIKYFFALNLFNSVGIIATLLSSVVETIKYLGVESCALSIVEGRSTDGTVEILTALIPELKKLGIEYHYSKNQVDPKEPGGDRIARLSTLRNQALEPLLLGIASHFTPDVTVVFPNDVALCPDDMLELLHQKFKQKGDIVCAMDWNMGGKIFYDVWVARDNFGEPFFDIHPGHNWGDASSLFPKNPQALKRFNQRKPVQVFACWNGMVVMNPRPMLKDGVRFRTHHPDECEMGEPTLLSKDYFKAGYGRIMIVPSVALSYSNEEGLQSKNNYGWTADNVELVAAEDPEPEEIKWMPKPAHMLCAPGHTPKWWVTTD